MKTYNPKSVSISLGTHIVKGYAEDSFVTVDALGDGSSLTTGADGEKTRNIDPDDSYSIKLVVQENSATNKFLNNELNKAKSGKGVFNVTINDTLGKSKFTGKDCFPDKPASWSRGKQAGTREWTIICASGTFKE